MGAADSDKTLVCFYKKHGVTLQETLTLMSVFLQLHTVFHLETYTLNFSFPYFC